MRDFHSRVYTTKIKINHETSTDNLKFWDSSGDTYESTWLRVMPWPPFSRCAVANPEESCSFLWLLEVNLESFFDVL